jgi:DHA3 family multidrug efflux protein-like MFS transporter
MSMSATEPTTKERTPRVFRQLLVNTLMTGVTSTFLWFALTFWVYLETRSVVATGVIGGAFSISSAVLGPFFGTFVDRHRKHAALVLTTAASLTAFAVATAVFVAVDSAQLLRLTSPWFWALVLSTLLGSVAGQLRGIVLSTCVTLLVPDGQRDKANGMVGTVTGVSFAVTSVFSGIVIGSLGMGWAYYGALVLTAVALVHVATISIDEPEPQPAADGADRPWAVDVRGAVDAIRAVPGLRMLILLAACNNLLAGVFMSLMDATGWRSSPSRRGACCGASSAWRSSPAACWSPGTASALSRCGRSSPATWSTGPSARSSPCGRRSCCW